MSVCVRAGGTAMGLGWADPGGAWTGRVGSTYETGARNLFEKESLEA